MAVRHVNITYSTTRGGLAPCCSIMFCLPDESCIHDLGIFVYLQGEHFILLFIAVISLTGKLHLIQACKFSELASTSDDFSAYECACHSVIFYCVMC